MGRVLDHYRRTPGTLGRVRPADRRLAAILWERRVPLELVETAFLLAASRRTLRPENEPALPPVRSLHYFLPVVDELIAAPPTPEYKRYLTETLSSRTETANTTDADPRHNQDQTTP